MIGLPQGKVFLVDYTEEWAAEYQRESDTILALVGSYIAEIHHVGSTAVPGLRAKPIIDMAVVLYRFESGFKCVGPLETVGYRHRIIPELPERHYFSKGNPRTHQIHMYGPSSRYFWEQITFRDRLRSDPELRMDYQRLKEELVLTHSTDKLAYADAKTDFIRRAIHGRYPGHGPMGLLEGAGPGWPAGTEQGSR